MINIKNALLMLCFTTLIFSCNSSRNLVYFSDLRSNETYKIDIKNSVEPKIQANDLLGITVNSLNLESNALFNRGALPPSTTGVNVDIAPISGYLVDKEGYINFPVLKKVMLAGLTREEAIDKMTDEIKKNVKDPIVNIRFLNFKVTVIGEVNKPATFTVPTEKINVLEALGLAGDMTVYGKRENVLLIREKDGYRSAIRLNLNDKALLDSPYFYLQQNDLLYVEPDKIREIQASTNTRSLTIASLGVSILVALIFSLQTLINR